MIAANYTMNLYCDCEDCKNGMWKYNNGVGEFIGASWTDVCRKARKAGWKISKDRTRAYAPNHKKKEGE